MNDNKPDLIIGIDYGTSNTVVTWRPSDGRAKVLYLKDPHTCSNASIPSIIFYPDENPSEILIGTEAEQAASDRRRNGVRVSESKLKLASSANGDEFKKGETEINDFFKCLFDKYIYEQIFQNLGYEYNNIIVRFSVPAKWNDAAKKAMIRAIKISGFGQLENSNHKVVIECVDEPRAALSYSLHRKERFIPKELLKAGILNCFLLDMGAGTSDITVFQVELYTDDCGRLKTKDIDPQKRINYPERGDEKKLCGGGEIDSTLYECILKKMEEQLHVVPSNFSVDHIKTWKEIKLSPVLKKGDTKCTHFPIQEDAFDAFCTREHIHESLATQFKNDFGVLRYDFENWTRKHWDDLNRLIVGAISDFEVKTGLSAKDIDLVFLTGGHAQWYCVEDLFNGNGICDTIGKNNGFEKIKFDNNRIIRGDRPSQVVASGLCVHNLGFKVPNIAANDMYISFSIEGKTRLEGASEQIDLIIKKDEDLPKKISITQTLPETKALWLEYPRYKLILKLYEGGLNPNGTYKEANYTTYERKWGCNIYELVRGTFRTERTTRFKAVHDVEISEDQRISIVTQIYADDWPFNPINLSDFVKANL